MSVVTSIILKTNCSEEEYSDAIENINAYLITQKKGKLNKVDELCGGFKYIQCDVYMGGFNYLDTEYFLNLCNKQKWKYSEDVQIYIMEEQEYLLTEHRIKYAST